MGNRMRFGTSMEILYDNILSDARDIEIAVTDAVEFIRFTYQHYRNSKYNAYETLDENMASKYVVHTLNLNEK